MTCSYSCSSTLTRPPPRSPLFPYTTLFRSRRTPGRTRRADRCWGSGGPARGGVRGGGRDPVPPPPPVPGGRSGPPWRGAIRSEEHTSELQSRENLVCRLLLEKKKKKSSQSI